MVSSRSVTCLKTTIEYCWRQFCHAEAKLKLYYKLFVQRALASCALLSTSVVAGTRSVGLLCTVSLLFAAAVSSPKFSRAGKASLQCRRRTPSPFYFPRDADAMHMRKCCGHRHGGFQRCQEKKSPSKLLVNTIYAFGIGCFRTPLKAALLYDS